MTDSRTESAVVTNDVAQIEAAAWIQKSVQLRFSPVLQNRRVNFLDLTSVQLTVLSHEEEKVKPETHKQLSTEHSHSKALVRQRGRLLVKFGVSRFPHF